MSEPPESFADYPVSVLEAKANRSSQGAGVWTCRDALIACLRSIDNGEVQASEIAIIVKNEEGETSSFEYWQRCESTSSLLGIYATASFDTLSRMRG